MGFDYHPILQDAKTIRINKLAGFSLPAAPLTCSGGVSAEVQ